MVTTLDKDTRNAIALAVENGMARRMEMYEEVWLTGEQLCERFGLLCQSRLRRWTAPPLRRHQPKGLRKG